MKVYLLSFTIFCASLSYAGESSVSAEMNDIYLQATGKLTEPSRGGIEFPEWKLGGEAKFTQQLSLAASVGSSSLLYLPSWVTSSSSNGFALLDFKAILRNSAADIYAGQFLVPFGLEGLKEEKDLSFPRSLLYENSLIPLRDYGLGIYAQNDGFSFNIAAHSGRGGVFQAQPDGRAFVTGQWAYESPTRESLGLSLMAGHYLNNNTETKLRGGNLFFKFHFFSLRLELEGSLFQTITNGVDLNFLAWHSDGVWAVSDSVNFLARFEQHNPNTKINNAIQGRGYIGLEWHGKNSYSRLFIFGIKNYETGIDTPNDEVQLTWRITPF